MITLNMGAALVAKEFASIAKDVLYVASTADNAIFAVPNVGSRTVPPLNGIIFRDKHLRAIGVDARTKWRSITGNGATVDADVNQPSRPWSSQKTVSSLASLTLIRPREGRLDCRRALGGDRARFAAVEDNTNDISVYTLRTGE
jgi:hypothetical protein